MSLVLLLAPPVSCVPWAVVSAVPSLSFRAAREGKGTGGGDDNEDARSAPPTPAHGSQGTRIAINVPKTK